MDIKRIVAREGLIIIGFIGLFVLSFHFPALQGFALLGYPLYLLIRFIGWALKTLFPQYFIISKLKKLTDNHKYLESLNLMETLEKDTVSSDFKNKDWWKSIKKTCLEGTFATDIYAQVSNLMNEGKLEEAGKLSNYGLKTMLTNKEFFGITEEEIGNFQKELLAVCKDNEKVKISDLVDFRKEYIKKVNLKSNQSYMVTLCDFWITSIICEAKE